MPKIDWNDVDSYEEEIFREKVQKKVKPKKKRKSYNDVKQRENSQISKKHPTRK